VNRTDVIQAVIDHKQAKTYLEIGVADGDNFIPVRVGRKTGVDPQLGFKRRLKLALKALGRGYLSILLAEYHKATSDDFFARAASSRVFDVVFIDGLHTYEQSLKDVVNSIDHLAEGGVILMHDCYPPNAGAARSAGSWQEAVERELPGPDSPWCGDVWKTVCNLRSQRPDLTVFVLDCDFGIGVVSRGEPADALELGESELDAMTYVDLARDHESLLDLKDPSYLFEFLKGA
jgi:hypothetical protein